VTQTPFRRGTQALIKFERENNRRVRRVAPEEEARLLAASNSLVHMLIVTALDTGMRRGGQPFKILSTSPDQALPVESPSSTH
jgi:hypothetical protein